MYCKNTIFLVSLHRFYLKAHKTLMTNMVEECLVNLYKNKENGKKE